MFLFVIKNVNKMFLFFFFIGHLHHGVYVLGFIETVPEAHEAQCEETVPSGVETLVHTNSFRVKVRLN